MLHHRFRFRAKANVLPVFREARQAAAQAEKDQYAAQVAQTQRENDALAADIAQGPTPEKIEEIARNELGLVTPNEYVFDDISN